MLDLLSQLSCFMFPCSLSNLPPAWSSDICAARTWGRPETNNDQSCGCFENLLDEPGYKVKRIMVYPGQKLSLQRHQFRAEHWTVVEGIAWVRNGDDEFALGVSGSTFIPQQAIHRLENRTEEMVVLIEVQTGSYTGEDDIERLEDIYGRIR